MPTVESLLRQTVTSQKRTIAALESRIESLHKNNLYDIEALVLKAVKMMNQARKKAGLSGTFRLKKDEE